MSTPRKITKRVQGFATQDGAGVHLIRVLNNSTIKDFDPFLMMDSFDSTNPDDYKKGFPLHPHRGIETISYVARGYMQHRDTLGFEDTVGDGEVQWMCAGSGIEHEETIPASERLLGIQLWLNLPKAEKMSTPAYRAIKADQIEEIPFDEGRGTLRLLAGNYEDHHGAQGTHLPLDYYDLVMEPGAKITFASDPNRTAMAFTLLGEATIADEAVGPKTCVLLSEGDEVTVEATASETGEKVHVLYMSAPALHEPVAWGGPIVMNTREEVRQAFNEYYDGTFIK
ncbi:MAG: pirin family protein [Atopobiaceae bacterium]|jgi:redox-sensitive bicupin YhaK (pirin superfamily)